jgi:methylenetetrahydrofolate dehydrogenase (NADP+)/methenyltetrahydrofolate cyclohydrolase
VLKFSARDTEKDILQAIKELNQDENIHGIIVQLPLPKKFDASKIIHTIDPRKDADGFFAKSVAPVFPQAIIKLLDSCPKVQPSGLRRLNLLRAVVIANSKIFGETMAEVLAKKKIRAEYILMPNVKGQMSNIKSADIVITAVGRPGWLKGEMLKKGAIVIDGGISKRGAKVLGDADFASVSKVAGALSPVPGGVGPVTIACLLQNTCNLSRSML